MDNLTHSLIGAVTARAGLSKRFGPGTTWILVVSSNLPDIDAIWAMMVGGDSFLSRRMLTHSVVGVPALALLCALLFHRLYKNISFRAAFGLSLLGAFLHVFFDLVNSYGVVLFYPLSRQRWELAWIFIIDLALWVLLLGTFILAGLSRRRLSLQTLCRVSAGMVALYVAICAGARHRAGERIKAAAGRYEEPPSFSYVFPEALGPHRWHAVVKRSASYDTFLIDLRKPGVQFMETVSTDESDPAVITARSSPEGKRLDWFFKAPVWTVEKKLDGTTSVFARDLRFSSFVLARLSNPFAFQFKITGDTAEYQGRRRE
jgi:membrane-bound metal-dependent hydrolase YbcI (DUF457 family)